MQTKWRTKLILYLILVSLFFYGLNYIIFKDLSFMARLLTLQLGFVPISVILITLFLNQLIARREKTTRLAKLNMVIGSFFSEIGTPLLKLLPNFDPNRSELSRELDLASQWSDRDFSNAIKYLNKRDYTIQIQKDKLEELRNFLLGKRILLLRIVENPNLFEHESFTDLLQAMFHLTDELAQRDDVRELPDTDYEHLANDIQRAYIMLISEWLAYLQHLKDNYPYFYSLAVRTNPLNPDASPEVV